MPPRPTIILETLLKPSSTRDRFSPRYTTMAAVLGKRKRRADLNNGENVAQEMDQSAAARYKAIMQKHFESQYEPLAIAPLAVQNDNDSASGPDEGDEDEDEEVEDWSGISDDGAPDEVEVMDISAMDTPKLEMSKEERKSFMVHEAERNYCFLANNHRAPNRHRRYEARKLRRRSRPLPTTTPPPKPPSLRMTSLFNACCASPIFFPLHPRVNPHLRCLGTSLFRAKPASKHWTYGYKL
jgi:hypothetical protein